MALTTEMEITLASMGFTKLYDDEREMWREMARDAFEYVKKRIAEPKPEDVSHHLAFSLLPEDSFRTFMTNLSGNYSLKKWSVPFADLIIHRVWKSLVQEE